MNTQSHAILTFFILRKFFDRKLEKIPNLNMILFSGALLPDFPLYVFFIWYTFIDSTPQRIIWRNLYFKPEWQIVFDSFHSFPVLLSFILVFLVFKKKSAILFFLSAFLASCQDFLVHHEDAHAHFFPLSGYRFASPVSYWNPAHYGQYFTVFEAAAVIMVSIWIYKRLESSWGKILLVFAVIFLVANNKMWSVIFTVY